MEQKNKQNNKPQMNMPRFNMNWIHGLVILALGLLYFTSGQEQSSIKTETSYSDFKVMVMKGYADKIEVNKGMLVENLAAQMLVASGHKLYFHSESSPGNAKNRMEIDFVVSKSKLARRHNVMPIEIKSGANITHASLDKFRNKYAEWCGESFLFSDRDVRMENGITYLPHYMLPLV